MQDPIKLLLVDDSEDDAEYFRELIDAANEGQFSLHEVDNAATALSMLLAEDFDCVIIDYNMPGHNGIWLIEEITRRGLPPATILLTGGGSEKLAVESLKSGSQDYLVKTELTASLLASTIRDSVTARHKEHVRQRRTTLDFLTGLCNREYFQEILNGQIQKAKRNSRKIAIIYLNLDDFGRVNQQYGHNIGDEVLIEVATRLKNSTRIYDVVARAGGDEFVCLLDEIPEDVAATAETFFARIVKNIAEKPIKIGDFSFKISASMGVVVFPDSATTAEDLVSLSDRAMYEAKATNSGYKIVFQDSADHEKDP